MAVDDFGNIVNPMIVAGQVHGGIAQGLGQAMMEGCVYDTESGQLLTGSYMDYTMPRADDLPNFTVDHTVTPCTHNPLGVKGCGEAGAIGSPPAFMNALTDALGVRDIAMPATAGAGLARCQRPLSRAACPHPNRTDKEHTMYTFDYQRPADAAGAAAAFQGDARYLAGGQSLIQAMKLRLSSSERLVDLGGISELKGIRIDGGNVVIGAITTHATVARSAEVQKALPALAELAGGIGDQMVRNMGTLGGSVANADPAACYPAAILGLGATVHTNQRTIAGDDFFTGLYETALKPGELITAVSFPATQKAAYIKFKQPASRFALVGVFVSQGAGGVRVAVTGCKGSVFRATAIEQALNASFTPAAAKAVKLPTDDINSDLHGSAEYRAAMISVMAGRAVEAILAR